MITQNLIQSFFWAVTSYDIYNTFKGKDLGGIDFSYRNPKLNTIFNITPNVTYSTLYTSHGGNILYFGTGTKEATVSDYKLQSPIEDDVFTPGSASTIYNTNYPGNYTITQSFVYNGSTDVTITEVGLINSVAKSANVKNPDDYARLLMAREVLENPITVSKGQQFVVTMTIS